MGAVYVVRDLGDHVEVVDYLDRPSAVQVDLFNEVVFQTEAEFAIGHFFVELFAELLVVQGVFFVYLQAVQVIPERFERGVAPFKLSAEHGGVFVGPLGIHPAGSFHLHGLADGGNGVKGLKGILLRRVQRGAVEKQKVIDVLDQK